MTDTPSNLTTVPAVLAAEQLLADFANQATGPEHPDFAARLTDANREVLGADDPVRP